MPSYLRAYLDNGLWGKDTLWDGVARNAFTVYMGFYLVPEADRQLSASLHQRAWQLPEEKTSWSTLPPEAELETELELINARSQRGAPRHHPRQPAPGGQRCQALYRSGQLLPGLDPGRQYRLVAGGHQVRPDARLQVQHLCHLVDPPVDQPLDRRPGAHHPHPGAYLRVDQPPAARAAQADPAVGPRAQQ